MVLEVLLLVPEFAVPEFVDVLFPLAPLLLLLELVDVPPPPPPVLVLFVDDDVDVLFVVKCIFVYLLIEFKYHIIILPNFGKFLLIHAIVGRSTNYSVFLLGFCLI